MSGKRRAKWTGPTFVAVAILAGLAPAGRAKAAPKSPNLVLAGPSLSAPLSFSAPLSLSAPLAAAQLPEPGTLAWGAPAAYLLLRRNRHPA